MLKITIITLAILACAPMLLHASSNCYLKLVPAEQSTIAERRELIESYGGRIIHEFPETGEFICWMAPSQFELSIERTLHRNHLI